MPKLAIISDHGQPGAVAARLAPERPVGDAGQGRLHQPVLQPQAADLEGLGHRPAPGGRGGGGLRGRRGRALGQDLARIRFLTASPAAPTGRPALSSWMIRSPSSVSSGSFSSICTEWRHTSSASPPVAMTSASAPSSSFIRSTMPSTIATVP